MYLEEQIAKFRALDEWFLSEQGTPVTNAFIAELISIKYLLHGETLLQLGTLGNNSFLYKFRFQNRLVVSPFINTYSNLISLVNHLPLDRESIDCIIAPLTLDAFSDYINQIDEMDRVLKPLGHIVFYGVNPFSLWGLWLRLSKNNCFGIKHGIPRSVLTIKMAMRHRGYIPCHLSSFYYIPPIKTKYWINKYEIFNEIGKITSLIPGGFYCFVVQKEQENLIPLIELGAKKSYIPAVSSPFVPTFIK